MEKKEEEEEERNKKGKEKKGKKKRKERENKVEGFKEEMERKKRFPLCLISEP